MKAVTHQWIAAIGLLFFGTSCAQQEPQPARAEPTDAQENAAVRQVPPKLEPIPDGKGAAEPPSEPRWRRLLSPTTVLIVLIVIVFGLAFAFRGPLQQFWVSRVQPVIPNPFDRAGTEELMPFELFEWNHLD